MQQRMCRTAVQTLTNRGEIKSINSDQKGIGKGKSDADLLCTSIHKRERANEKEDEKDEKARKMEPEPRANAPGKTGRRKKRVHHPLLPHDTGKAARQERKRKGQASAGAAK
jgi:hypothetical protein